MVVYGIPGVNGLGRTKGVEVTPEKFLSKSKILRLDNEDLEFQEKEIYEFAKKINLTQKIIFMGGDHSISFPLAKRFFEIHPSGKLVVFDAHPDLMEPLKEPTHEEWLRGLIDLEDISGENILIVGVRRNSKNVDPRELDFAKKKGIGIIFSDEFDKKKKEILDFVSGPEKVYCSFDFDVFDSSIFSSTGYPEKEGLLENQVIILLRKIKEKILWADLVEYNFFLDLEKKGIELVEKVLKTLDWN